MCGFPGISCALLYSRVLCTVVQNGAVWRCTIECFVLLFNRVMCVVVQ